MAGLNEAQGSLADEVWRRDEISTGLVEAGALTNADVLIDLQSAWDYVTQEEPVNDAESEVRDVVRTQLAAEIRIVEALPSNGKADATQWPRQRAAIERAYAFTTRNGDLLRQQADEAAARADTLNGMLDSAAEGAKTAGKGLEGLLTIVVVLVVALLVASIAGKVRT